MLPRTVVNVRAWGIGRSQWVHPSNTADYNNGTGLGGYRVEIYEGPDGPLCLVIFREVKSCRIPSARFRRRS